MHYNFRPPESRQSFFVLTTTPCQVWSRWTYPLRIIAFFSADIVTLTFELWPWTFALYRRWRDEALYQIWTQSSNPRQSYCDFINRPYDLEHCVTCCARLWENFHQVWPLTTYPCLNYNVSLMRYVMSRCDLDLLPADLESSWDIKHHVIKVLRNLSEIEPSLAELWLIWRIFADVSLWSWPLTSLSWTFTKLRVSCF